jgi:23S rRNA pseudouridine2605 synthase
VFELVPAIPGLTYVGRLDIMSSGLLLLTTDGALANRLLHPRYAVERTYRVRVRGRSAADIRRALSKPIVIDARPVRIVRSTTRPVTDACDIDLVLAEGRYRIVRRLCDRLGLRVERLRRLSHGPIALGRLPTGKWRYLNSRELAMLHDLQLT